ncbi:protein kinase domain-containing protein [Nonomuraea sp. KM88]|uniref:protein kinase domain-containing protein n=1 Tax=Nonomuraea sp. KM88 TaxID=3457427 RepID=UPI003FCDBE12
MSSVEDRLLAGRYRLVSPIGTGGMGTVWHAHDERLDREVAIKEVRLPPELGPGERAELCARMVREAQAASRLKHPGIVTVHDVLTRDDRPWIVMRLLRGRPLDRVIRDSGVLPVRQVARLGLGVLDALATAHAAGVLHRDIKPANIFVGEDGAPILTDFGIATVEGQATITESGMLVGSPGYIAPERLRGERPGRQSDLWSLAATLYEAAEGEPAHPGGDAMAVLARVLTEEARPPRRSGSLGPLLTRMLAREPAQRPAAELVRRTLASIAQDAEPPPLPAPAALPSGRRALPFSSGRRTLPLAGGGGRRRRLILAAGTAALLVSAGTLAVTNLRGEDPPPVASPPPAVSVTATSPSAVAQPVEEEQARFPAPIDLCTLVTAEQAAEIVPGASPRGGTLFKNGDSTGCRWTVEGRGLFVSEEPFGTVYPEMWDSQPVDAHDAYVNLRNHLHGGDKRLIVWTRPSIGVTQRTQSDQTGSTDVPGLGAEALTYDLLVRHQEDVISTTVAYRLSNVLLEVTYTDMKDGSSERTRERALRAARWTAAALEERAA